jgi:hypothetical protein
MITDSDMFTYCFRDGRRGSNDDQREARQRDGAKRMSGLTRRQLLQSQGCWTSTCAA